LIKTVGSPYSPPPLPPIPFLIDPVQLKQIVWDTCHLGGASLVISIERCEMQAKHIALWVYKQDVNWLSAIFSRPL
jgi:hypothetical protein